jgi:hypothetical protein
MSVNVKNVFTGAPDQATTGAILRAPLGTALPTSLAATLDAAFVDSGYIDPAGLKLTPDRSINSIKDWNMQTIRDVLEEFNASLAWNHLETNAASLKNYVGDPNVAVTAPTSSVGTLITTLINGVEIPHYSWVMKIKDGIRKALIVVPDAQTNKQEALTFVKKDAVMWGVTIKTFVDSAGNNVYIYTTDGVTTA